MDKFLELIYQNYAMKHMEDDLFFGKGRELLDEVEKILSVELCDKIYHTFCASCEEIEKAAFIAGFVHATNCISNGKIEL